MKIEIIRRLLFGNEMEYLCKVDEELLSLYKKETKIKDFTQDSFNRCMKKAVRKIDRSEEF